MNRAMLHLIGCFLAMGLSGPVMAQQRVPLELVLAMDVSTSVDAAEFRLQQVGLAGAFLDPSIQAAIKATGGVAVSVVQWAGEGSAVTSVNWDFIETTEQATRLSERIFAAPRLTRGFTSIDGAIRFSTEELEQNAYLGERRVIDVSGDGTASTISPVAARNAAVAKGIVVNGLVILVGDMDLGILADNDTYGHYRDQVIGGPGAFLIKADGFEDFARAIREKLLREISGPMVSGRPWAVAAR